jgi:hypothetical protein
VSLGVASDAATRVLTTSAVLETNKLLAGLGSHLGVAVAGRAFEGGELRRRQLVPSQWYGADQHEPDRAPRVCHGEELGDLGSHAVSDKLARRFLDMKR